MNNHHRVKVMKVDIYKMKNTVIHSILLTFFLFYSMSALGNDLVQVFQLAQQNDPDIKRARANFNASHFQNIQGRSSLLPSINLSGRTSRDTSGVDGQSDSGLGSTPEHSFANGYNSKSYGLSLRQTILNFESWYSFKSSEKNDEVAGLNLAVADQQLIIRVATAYFDVLRSEAALSTYIAEETAAQQILDETQQRFELGSLVITDVYDSQANADLASVNKLIEQNNHEQKLRALEVFTGQAHTQIDSLKDEFVASSPDMTVEDWIATAMNNNLDILLAEMELAVRNEEAKAARAGSYPTIDLSMDYNWNQSGNSLSFTPNLPSENTQITLSLTVPLYAGGANRARKKQAYYTRDASIETLVKAERDSVLNVQNEYYNLQTDVLAVAARAKALESARAALDSTLAGQEIGTRNVVDVVQAQRTMFQASRDFENARFDYIIDSLALKQASGTLSPQDLIDLNTWLGD